MQTDPPAGEKPLESRFKAKAAFSVCSPNTVHRPVRSARAPGLVGIHCPRQTVCGVLSAQSSGFGGTHLVLHPHSGRP